MSEGREPPLGPEPPFNNFRREEKLSAQRFLRLSLGGKEAPWAEVSPKDGGIP